MSGSTSRGLAPESYGPTITIGEILVEIMATTIGDGFLEPLTLTGPYPSGAPAIFIDQVAKMGGSAGIIACVGDDDFGRLNTRRLDFDGVDVSAVSVSKDRPTGSAFVRYRPDGSRDFVFNIGQSAAGQVALTDAAKTLIGRAGHVHVMGSAFAIPGVGEIIQLAVESVRARGGSVSFDPNFRKELVDGENGRALLEQMLAVTDLLLPSDEELHLAAAEGDEREAVDKLLGMGISEIVLKRGRAGSSFFTNGDSRHASAFSVSEIDPTGAGDCFGATYLTARRAGLSPDEALRYANAAGARNVTKQGPMEGTSTREELNEFISSTKMVTE